MSISSEQVVKVGDYEVLTDLLRLTGCAEEIFESYGAAQFNRFQEELNIQSGHTVLEIGCGEGRLAIPATHYLDSSGAYIGMDITARYPAFQFFAADVYSQIHNPGGSKRCADVVFPLPNQFVDRISLSSMFTHIFPADAMHYLADMNRVLIPDGAALAYFEETYLHMLYASGFQLKKPIEYGQLSGVGTDLTGGQDYVIFGKV